jgi:hypothetical protein
MKIQAAAVLGILVASLGGANDARACGFFNYHEYHPVVQHKPVPVAKAAAPKQAPPVVPASERIATADQRLDEEKLSMAATEVLAAFPAIKGAPVGATPIETRAHIILALALARSGGTLPGATGFTSTREADRAANLEWAVATLRQVEATRHNDPVAQANLGEALAARAGYEDEALGILAPLAGKDLLGSAHAYAALAKLRASRGERLASDDATKRCEVMTKSPEAVCHMRLVASADARLAARD